MTRAMYHVENPEDYLTHRGSTIKPLTPKSEEKHKMNDEIINIILNIFMNIRCFLNNKSY